MPPFSLSKTERVDEYGEREAREDGVSHSKNAADVGPRNLWRLYGEKGEKDKDER